MFFWKRKKIILIVGPTSSGKSSFAVNLAKKNNSEIISVDSRQVFKEIPNFSGAITKEEMENIPHYFIGDLSLKKKEEFNIAKFQKKTFKKINEILDKNKIPILVGGSSFFFESILYKNFLPEVEPNFELRKELEKKTKEELFQEILEKDPKTANRIDKNNPVRLIRAIEIIRKNGFVPKDNKKLNKKYTFEIYFLNPNKKDLDEKIEMNFLSRVDKMIKEAEILRSKISAEKFKQLGLAYKNIFNFWNKEISKEEFIKLGILEEQHYAKKQKTYLKKMINKLEKFKDIKINKI